MRGAAWWPARLRSTCSHVNVYSLFAHPRWSARSATPRCGCISGKVEESTGHLHKLNELYLATIKALAMAIDAKDQVTHGHIRRVQVYAVGLAKALGVTDEPTLKGIEAGALLHDTGKIAVPEHILNKPGKLTAQEYERMKTHVTIGADILSGIDFPYPVIPYVRHHHENWDGTGYPDGLAGEDDSSRRAHPLGRRLLRRADLGSPLPPRALDRGRARHPPRTLGQRCTTRSVVAKFIEAARAADRDADHRRHRRRRAGSPEITSQPAMDVFNGRRRRGGDRRRPRRPVAARGVRANLPTRPPSSLTNRLKRRLRS